MKDEEHAQLISDLQSSFFLFVRTFYPILTGRDFIISNPAGRESHIITVSRELVKCANLETLKLVINIPPGHGKPVCKNTFILTESGERKRLGDIVVGDRVLTHKGRFKKVTKVFEQGLLPTLKIKTFGGRKVISAYDHPFLTPNGWIEAKDLKVNNVLAVAYPEKSFGCSIKPEEARLLGYFIGDGCVTGNAANITACDLFSISDIEACCVSLGFVATSQQYNLKNRKPHHSQTLVRINIKNGVREWIESHGIKDKNSYTKRVPKAIMEGDFEAIKHFMGAYFACDGTFGHKGQGRRDTTASVTSVSKGLIEDCQHLMMRLGIRTRVRTKIANIKTKAQGDTYTSYLLEFTTQDDMYHFQRLISDKIHHKKADILRNHVFVRQRFDSLLNPDHIISIEENEAVDCRCLEVEEDHTFTANDIVVHNSTLLAFWTAWCLAKNPDSRFLYISYSQTLAASHTDTIRRILMMREFKELFGVELRPDSKAKDYFQTTSGGAVGAFGSAGAITGRDAGLPGLDRFSGALILDDPHKPDEVYSDTIREKVIQNYRDTIQQRARGINVPFIMIGQRLHEADLAAYLLAGEDGHDWRRVILKSIDDAGNALYPEAFPLKMLRIRQEKDIYVFASQHQQDPQPAGGSLFKQDWFIKLDLEPDIIVTFITADTAETDKSYNDATVFSFWGLYEIESFGKKTGEYALHWIDCQELRVEPKDLKEAFIDFYSDCMRYKLPPKIAFIEKKSTGVTLTSVLSDLRGLQVRGIERNRSSGSKTQRFLTAQPYVAAKQISFTKDVKHAEMCINHMSKITANDSHRHDDIADTLCDAVKIGLIDKTILYNVTQNNTNAATILLKQKSALRARSNLYGGQQNN